MDILDLNPHSKDLKIVVTHFDNLQISRIIANPLEILVMTSYKSILQNISYNLKEKYPCVCVGALVSICVTDI